MHRCHSKRLQTHNFALRHVVECMDHLAWMIWRKAYLQPSDWLKAGGKGHLIESVRSSASPAVSRHACQLSGLSADMP